MISFVNRYIATIILLLSVLISSFEITILGKPISNYVNLQLILIYVFKISNPSLNFGKGIFLFLISIINDVLNGLWFGTSGILYFIVFAVAAFQASIKLRSFFISEWISVGVSLIIAYCVFFGLEFLHHETIYKNAQTAHFHMSEIVPLLTNFIITLLVYPIFWFIISKLVSQNAYR